METFSLKSEIRFRTKPCDFIYHDIHKTSKDGCPECHNDPVWIPRPLRISPAKLALLNLVGWVFPRMRDQELLKMRSEQNIREHIQAPQDSMNQKINQTVLGLLQDSVNKG